MFESRYPASNRALFFTLRLFHILFFKYPSRLPFKFYFCFSMPRQGGIPLPSRVIVGKNRSTRKIQFTLFHHSTTLPVEQRSTQIALKCQLGILRFAQTMIGQKTWCLIRPQINKDEFVLTARLETLTLFTKYFQPTHSSTPHRLFQYSGQKI